MRKALSIKPSSTPQKQPTPPTRIRVETAISRFPIHCLSRRGVSTIDLQQMNDDGVADFRWEVTYNSKHGQPGPLAYKIDTLVINRLFDQLGRPLPEIIRIGSLSEVCRSLGTQDTGPNIANLKSAFLQNASAFINAKIRYKTKTGREKWAEMGYTRYSVVFTGEALPDGTVADAVHIILNPPYRELLNHVETRPLDYDYLKRLPPGPQRFYELLSFQVYGAIAGGRARAKMLYSDYCKYAPQVRYGDFDHVKKQMYKVALPHREAGYITKVEYEEKTDVEGKADWEMLYTPGPKAFVEYEAFTHRQSRTLLIPEHHHSNTPTPESISQGSLEFQEYDFGLFSAITGRGISRKKAVELLTGVSSGQEVMDQIEYVDLLITKDRQGKLQNPAGLLIYYIRENILPPPDFESSRKAKLRIAAEQIKNAEASNRARFKIEYEEYRSEQLRRFAESLSAEEYKQLFDEQRRLNKSRFKSMTNAQVNDLSHATVRVTLEKSDRLKYLSFEEFVHDRTRTEKLLFECHSHE